MGANKGSVKVHKVYARFFLPIRALLNDVSESENVVGFSLFRTFQNVAHLAPYLMSACFLACLFQEFGCCTAPPTYLFGDPKKGALFLVLCSLFCSVAVCEQSLVFSCWPLHLFICFPVKYSISVCINGFILLLLLGGDLRQVFSHRLQPRWVCQHVPDASSTERHP